MGALQNCEISMNTKSNRFNYSAVTLLTACTIVAGMTLACHPAASPVVPSHYTTAPSVYGVKDIKLTSKDTGIATIRLDDFILKANFQFETHPDSYGVVGSDFTAVNIINLYDIEISDLKGNKYRDFTNYEDHLNINNLIATYVENNKLTEE
ncbi:MAG: hypothetical protein CL490_07985 [Acinetobacter sp.]|nr:hypothetical protein [Acinetobacter sp.]